MKRRSIGESPFCWQAKAILKSILEAFEQDRGAKASSAVAVYCALTHIASDCGQETFETTVGNIGKYAGLSSSMVHRILSQFESLGIVHIQRNRIANTDLQGASSYTLQSVDEIFQSADDTLCKFYTPPAKKRENQNLQTI